MIMFMFSHVYELINYVSGKLKVRDIGRYTQAVKQTYADAHAIVKATESDWLALIARVKAFSETVIV